MGANSNRVVVVIAGENQASAVIHQVEAALGGLGKTANTFDNILKGISIGLIVEKLGEMARAAIDTATNFLEMSQRTGIAVETLTALNYAAKQNGVSTDDLEKGLRKLAKTVSDAATGIPRAADALGAVGVKARTAAGAILPIDQALAKVADRFARMKDGTQKAALATELFGKSGTMLIPLLNNGAKGIAALEAEARRLGITLSQADAEALKRLGDDLDTMEAVVKSLAMALIGGLAPAITNVAKVLTGDLGAGFSTAKAIGEGAGWVVEHLALGLYALGIAAAWTAHKVALLGEAFALALVGEGKAASESLQQFLGIMDDEVANVLSDKLAAYAAALSAGGSSSSRRSGGLADAERRNRELEALQKERLKQEMENEKLATDYIQSLNQLELARTEQLYKAQLISAQEYYNKKRELQAADLRASIAGIQAEISLQEAALKRAKDEKERTGILGELNRLSEQLTVKTAELNRVLGLTPAGAPDTMVREANAMELAGLKAEELGRKIDAVFARLATASERIRLLVETRQISELEGERLLNEERAKAAAELQGMVTEYGKLAQASGDPRLMQNAAGFALELEKLHVKLNAIGDDIRNTFVDEFSNAVAGVVTGTTSIGDAFKSMARAVLAELARIIARMLILYILSKLLGGLFGGGGTTGAVTMASFALGESAPTGRAQGGRFTAGQPFIAGELGMPELIVPENSGTVVSSGRLQRMLGSGGGDTYNIDARGADIGVQQRIEALEHALPQTIPVTMRAVTEYQRRS